MRFTTFDTSIGTVGILFSETKLERIQLPEASTAKLKAKLKSFGAEEAADLPPFVRIAARVLAKHLKNGKEDLTSLAAYLDLAALPPFHQKVYKALLKVPAGKVVTYQILAREARSPKAVRAVGQAMAKNRFPLVIPCHRVVQTSGALGNFSAHEGVALKAKLLKLEEAL